MTAELIEVDVLKAVALAIYENYRRVASGETQGVGRDAGRRRPLRRQRPGHADRRGGERRADGRPGPRRRQAGAGP